jgi:hypothetical protein
MALSYNLIPLKDLSRGVDLRSAESNVADGYCEDLQNVVTVSSGHLAKRPGYQGFAGYVPFRVKEVTHDGYQISMKLDRVVNLSTNGSSPLLVYGKFPQAESGDYSTTAQLRYYAAFSVDVRDVFSSGATSIAKTTTDHGLSTDDVFVYVLTSTSEANNSSSYSIVDGVEIDSGDYEITITYTPATTERVFILIIDKSASAGENYVADYSGSPIAPSGGVVTGTITAATHALSNFNIIPKLYTVSAGVYSEFIPDTFAVDDSTGDVTFTFTSGSNFDGQVVLTTVPIANAKQASVGAGETATITITDLETDFPYWALYRLNGTSWELAIPDSVTVDDATDTITVTITNASTSAETYEFYYDFTSIPANTIRVVDSTATSTTYTGTTIDDPALTVWGIDHADKYSDDAERGGHVLHIDSYKREEEARLVCGLGGNMYAARTRSEVGTTYQMPALTVDLDSRVASAVSMAPLFQVTGTSASIRTRGIITADNVSSGYATVTGVSYVSSGVADYTISLTNKSGTLALNTQVATTDYITVSGMAHSVHNGTFKISTVTDGASSVVIRVENSSLLTSDFDETGASGLANVFTDRFTTSSTAPYIGGDVITAESIGSSLTLTVTTVSSTTVTVSGVTEQVDLAQGVTLFGRRTAYVQPLKNSTGVASVQYLVPGDMVTVTSLTRQPRIVHVHPFQNISCSITVASGTATVSLGGSKTISSVDTTDNEFVSASHGFSTNDPIMISTTESLPTGLRTDSVYFVSRVDADTFKITPKEDGTVIDLTSAGSGTLSAMRVHNLSAGSKVTIAQTGDSTLDGVVTVVSTPDRGSFTYTTTSTTSSATGVLVGRTAEFDESLTFTDNFSSPTTVTVSDRWIPIEAPSPTGDLPKTTYVSYFDDTETTLRSCIVGGNMYFANQSDELMKFDGTNVYQAGLFRWQAQLFAQIDTGTGSLVLDAVSATQDGAASGNSFAVSTGQAIQFAAGDRIVHSGDSAVYTAQSVDTTHNKIYVTTSISDTTTIAGTLKKVKTYRYYLRLNAIDANNNVVASAATGAEDCIIELTANGQIRLRILPPPAWGVYDYDRIEAHIYRTIADTVAPFYRIRAVPVTFSKGYQYIDIYDGTTDEVLTQAGDQDATMVALLGAELGTAWEQPPRAKYLTSVNNRLVLANIKDYQQLDIVIRKQAGAASVANTNLAGLTFLFRKTSTDSSTTTNMVDRIKYEFIAASGTFTFVDADVSTANDTITETAHGLLTGSAFTLSNSGGALPTGLAAATTYYAIKVDADTFKVATSAANANAGTAIDITAAAGGGTHTLTKQGRIGISGAAITRNATTFTVTSNAHGLSAGNWVYLFHAAQGKDNDLHFAGWAQISSVATNTFTVKFANGYTPSADDVDSYVTATTKTDIPVWLGTDGNYNQKDSNTTGSFEALAAVRLANAINASMVATDVTVSGQTDFVPWITANAGGEYALGQLVVRQPKYSSTTMEVALGTLGSNYDVYVNNVKRASSAEVSATTLIFPSRVVISYENHPETFDNPAAALQDDSDSVVDVNSADGEEITGVIPFFAETAFGQSQVESLVVVFKTNSVYLLDVRTPHVTASCSPTCRVSTASTET